MAEVDIHPEARREYIETLRWYFGRSDTAADRFALAFEETITALATSPAMYPADADGHRSIRVGRYPHRLIYRVTGASVLVVAVSHPSREPGEWSGRT